MQIASASKGRQFYFLYREIEALGIEPYNYSISKTGKKRIRSYFLNVRSDRLTIPSGGCFLATTGAEVCGILSFLGVTGVFSSL